MNAFQRFGRSLIKGMVEAGSAYSQALVDAENAKTARELAAAEIRVRDRAVDAQFAQTEAQKWITEYQQNQETQRNQAALDTKALEITTTADGKIYAIDEANKTAIELKKIDQQISESTDTSREAIAETAAGAQAKVAEADRTSRENVAQTQADAAKAVAATQAGAQTEVAQTQADAAKAVAQAEADTVLSTLRSKEQLAFMEREAELEKFYQSRLFGGDFSAQSEEERKAVAAVIRQLNTNIAYRRMYSTTDGYTQMLEGYRMGGSIGDAAMIIGMSRIFDPDSVVREGEVSYLGSTVSDMWERIQTAIREDKFANLEDRNKVMGLAQAIYNKRAEVANQFLSSQIHPQLQGGVFGASGRRVADIGALFGADARSLSELLDPASYPDSTFIAGGAASADTSQLGPDGLLSESPAAAGVKEVAWWVARAREHVLNGVPAERIRNGLRIQFEKQNVSEAERKAISDAVEALLTEVEAP